MMAPGVRHEAKAGAIGVGGISVDGASGSENSYFIDGVDVTDVMTGALRPQNSIPLEFVRELQVKSGGFEAEYRRCDGRCRQRQHSRRIERIPRTSANRSYRVKLECGRSRILPALRFRSDEGRVLAAPRRFLPNSSIQVVRSADLFCGTVCSPMSTTCRNSKQPDRTIDHVVDGRRVYQFDKVRHYFLGQAGLFAGHALAAVRFLGLVARARAGLLADS